MPRLSSAVTCICKRADEPVLSGRRSMGEARATQDALTRHSMDGRMPDRAMLDRG